ncbi:MAG TPA: hypothetical protein VIJ82_03265 [Streptosporangiaceae bacterium]
MAKFQVLFPHLDDRQRRLVMGAEAGCWPSRSDDPPPAVARVGLGFEGDAILSPPGRRRIYSNRGIEIVAETAAARGRSFEMLLADETCLPLGLLQTRLDGSPSWGAPGPLNDLVALAIELLSPSLVDAGLLAEVTRTAFPRPGRRAAGLPPSAALRLGRARHHHEPDCGTHPRPSAISDAPALSTAATGPG